MPVCIDVLSSLFERTRRIVDARGRTIDVHRNDGAVSELTFETEQTAEIS